MSAGVPTVGMIGGGQLARMTHQAGIGLGIRFRLLAEGPDVSAAQVVRDVTVGDYRDLDVLIEFAAGCDVVTFDHEHVPGDHIRALERRGVVVRPGSSALRFAQDKAAMRDYLSGAGIAHPTYRVVGSPAELPAGRQVLKTSRGGYDGKGVWVIDGPDDPQAAEPFAAGVPVITEELVDFRRELAAVVARSPSNQSVAYPVVESTQEQGICTEVVAPAPGLTEAQATRAQQLALRIAGDLDVTGVLAVELFETADGDLLVNELAMRPHNSGHWSIDGAVTSQFENHLRAVLDLPLGRPKPHGSPGRADWSVMVNVLGGDYPDLHKALLHCMARDPALRVHLYGKEVRPGRKVGHVTAIGPELASARERARHAAAYLTGEIEE